MARMLAISMLLAVLIATACSRRDRQVTFIHPQGYPVPHSLLTQENHDWKTKADLAIEVADRDAIEQLTLAEKTNTGSILEDRSRTAVTTDTLRSPLVQKSLSLWIISLGKVKGYKLKENYSKKHKGNKNMLVSRLHIKEGNQRR